MPLTSYQGLHAEYYDSFYSAKDYASEAKFVLSKLHQHQEKKISSLLEIACGTGGHCFFFEKAGLRVSALDNSVAMLEVAKKKAGREHSQVNFFLADFTDFSSPRAPFDAAVSLFNSIGYLTSDEALLSGLRAVHRNLTPSGLFFFDFWHAPSFLKGYEKARIKRVKLPEAELVRFSEVAVDEPKRLVEIKYQILVLGADGRYQSFHETQVNRFFTVPEMKGLVAKAGFELLAHHSGYSDSPATDDSFQVSFVVKKME